MPNTLYLGTYSQVKRINEPELFLYRKIGLPLSLPISIDEFQSQIRIDIALEQTNYLNLIIKSVIAYAENYMNLSLLNTQWQTARNNFDANAFELRKGYFVSLEKFQYLDADSYLWVDVDPSVFYLADKPYYAQILLKLNQEFPYEQIAKQDNAINIEFTAGMAETVEEFENLYPDLKMALLQHCCFAYENRGNDVAIDYDDNFNAVSKMIIEVYNRYRDQSIFSGTVYNI